MYFFQELDRLTQSFIDIFQGQMGRHWFETNKDYATDSTQKNKTERR